MFRIQDVLIEAFVARKDDALVSADFELIPKRPARGQRLAPALRCKQPATKVAEASRIMAEHVRQAPGHRSVETGAIGHGDEARAVFRPLEQSLCELVYALKPIPQPLLASDGLFPSIGRVFE